MKSKIKKAKDKLTAPFILTLLSTTNAGFDGVNVTANGTIAANAVTANGDSGILTTPSLTTAADTWEAAITWTNSKIVATSIIVLTVNGVQGTIGTNGCPHAVITAKGTGSCTLRVGNIGANALSAGAVTIAYLVINTVA